jgi:hypothetical protein
MTAVLTAGHTATDNPAPERRAGRRHRPGQRSGGTPGSVALPCRVRLQDGRVFSGELPAARHRALQLGMLHPDSEGLVELTPGTRPPDGKLELDQRRRSCHYLPGGAGEHDGRWLERLLEHAERIVSGEYAYKLIDGKRREELFDGEPREEAFVGVCPRTRSEGGKRAVEYTRWLWVDVDKPGELPALWALVAERPCHVLVESAGSGGVHAYWRLDRPLPAVQLDERTGELIEWIERANLRLIHRLGTGPDGKPTVGDSQCAERARVMRLAGTINHKTGRHARILQADLALDPYPIAQLVGDLPDPAAPPPTPRRRGAPRAIAHHDPYKGIAPPEYFEMLAGITVPASGRVRCPSPTHDDEHPSCDVGDDASQGWICRACGAGGAIYDLASVLLGGPTGQALRGEEFNRAQAYVRDAFGELA